MKTILLVQIRKSHAWLVQERHRQWASAKKHQVHQAFTTHPEESGETYLRHLWFTFCMSMRFVYVTVVLLIHGLFPFLLVRVASKQIELVYRVMKKRIPKARRDQIDTDYSV